MNVHSNPACFTNLAVKPSQQHGTIKHLLDANKALKRSAGVKTEDELEKGAVPWESFVSVTKAAMSSVVRRKRTAQEEVMG